MRNYLKHLRMGLNGIKKAKQVQQQVKSAADSVESKGTLDEITPKQASAIVDAAQKGVAAASVTNPPVKSAKKKGASKKKTGAKKKSVKK